jgi:biopolymer transport protein ExbD
MNFGAPRQARMTQDRAIVPMINVVFLLLVFFLMTASLTPAPPLEITTPTADVAQSDPPRGTFYIGADGMRAYGDARGDAALAALAQNTPKGALPILADARLPAAELARLLPELAALGITDIRLIAERP